MAARTYHVEWAESARDALDGVLGDLAEDSPSAASRLVERVLDAAGSLSTLPQRGRVVPEIGDLSLRELFIDRYRLMYRVHEHRVVIRAFLHGARDFATWQRGQANVP
jgi:plasmid stabilization system protein ParE